MRAAKLRSWLRAALHRRQWEREMDDELKFHVEAHVEELMRRGVARSEAERQAWVEFGGLSQTKELCRDAHHADLLEALAADIRHGVRLLRRNPSFAALAVLTLGLGIGATTAVFSVVNAVLLRGLPYRDPQQLVFLYESLPGIPNVPLEAWSPVNGDFFEWQRQSRSFRGMAMFTNDRLNLSVGDIAFRAVGSRVTADFFHVLGVAPILGRALNDADIQPGKERVAVISYALWQSRFASDPGVLAKQLALDARTYRIVGVMPSGFAFPHSSESLETAGTATDLWTPWVMTPNERASRDDNRGNAIGRLQPDVRLSRAQAEIATITGRFAPPFQQQFMKPQGVVRPFAQAITGSSRRPLLIFLAAVLLVLLIACSNVASLALARAHSRRQEISVRIALGASRGRLFRQLLAESLCAAFAGGALGTASAFLIVRLLVNFHPASIPRIEETSVDGRVLLFTMLVSLATAILSGSFPAWAGSRSDPKEAMNDAGSRGVVRGASRLHRGLLIGEMALTIVLLAASGLLIRSFVKLRSVEKGFSPESTVSMNIELYGRYDQPQKQNAFFHTLLERTRMVPGIQEAAAINHLPLGGGQSISVLEVEGYPFDEKTSFESRSVTPRYFAAMGIPLLDGRVFDEGDAAGRVPSILVSRSFAKRYFPGRSALGHRIRNSGWRTIVGVVADVRQHQLDATPPMQVYLPLWQTGSASASVVIRSNLPANSTSSILRSLVRDLDSGLAVGNVQTMDQLVSQASAERRFQTVVLTVFGGAALFISLVGLYALMAWSVQQRTAEIGIRLALGAQRGNVITLVLRQGALLWIVGMLLGLACAWGLTRSMSSLLFEVQSTDPLTFLAVAVLFCAVCLGACYAPARRAARVDPAVSLRYE